MTDRATEPDDEPEDEAPEEELPDEDPPEDLADELPESAYADRVVVPIPRLAPPRPADRPIVGQRAVEIWYGTTHSPGDPLLCICLLETPERRDPLYWRRILGDLPAITCNTGIWRADGTGLSRLWHLDRGEQPHGMVAAVDPHPREVVVMIGGLAVMAYRQGEQMADGGRPVYAPSPAALVALRAKLR